MRRHSLSEILEWAEAHRDFLAAVWHEFDRHGVWPEAKGLTRRHSKARPPRNFLATARDMPPALGRAQLINTAVGSFVSGVDDVIVLTPRALTFVPDADTVLRVLGTVIEIAVERFHDHDSEPFVTTAEFLDLLNVDERRARQLEELITID